MFLGKEGDGGSSREEEEIGQQERKDKKRFSLLADRRVLSPGGTYSGGKRKGGNDLKGQKRRGRRYDNLNNILGVGGKKEKLIRLIRSLNHLLKNG